MVQLFYYETRGKNFKKLISYEGIPFRVNLFPNEELGSTLNSYWIVKIPWWRKTTAKVLEVTGGHYRYATAKVTNLGDGNIAIKGQFKHEGNKSKFRQLLEFVSSASKDEKLSSPPASESTTPTRVGNFKRISSELQLDNFRLQLTTNVTNEDFQLGYSMTGTLEQGQDKALENMSLTHFAVVKRKGY